MELKIPDRFRNIDDGMGLFEYTVAITTVLGAVLLVIAAVALL